MIYTWSSVLLILMANCLKRLPIYEESLLQDRARILEKMIFYVFTYIIFGLCTGFLYSMNELINFNFHTWDTTFLSSRVLELLFYLLFSSRGILTSLIFLDNIKDMFVGLCSSVSSRNNEASSEIAIPHGIARFSPS